jgi:hypothetical protein
MCYEVKDATRRIRLFVNGREVVYRDLDAAAPAGAVDNRVRDECLHLDKPIPVTVTFANFTDGDLYADTTVNKGDGIRWLHAFAANTPAKPHRSDPSKAEVKDSDMEFDFVLIHRPGETNALPDTFQKLVRPTPLWRLLGHRTEPDLLCHAQTILGLWPAVQTQDSTIRVWGRSYEIAPTGLPRAVQSRDEPLLARPVAFRVNGSDTSDVQCRITATDKEEATWEASGTLAGVPYRCRGVAEFDGMMRFDVEWTASPSLPLTELRLEIPVRPTQAGLLHFYPPPYDFPAMTWPRPGHPNSLARPAYWRSCFSPFVWLGNEQRGLQWFCESDEGWRPADPNTALEIVTADSEVMLRIHLLDPGTKIDRPFRLTFGLMAGPVRPTPPTFEQGHFGYSHWTSYAMADPIVEGTNTAPNELDRRRDLGARFVGMHEEWTDFEGMSRVTQPEKLKRLVEQAHARKLGLVLYHSMLLPDIAPEYADLAADFLCEPQSAYYIHSREPKQRDYPICHRSRYSALFTDGIERLFKEYGIDGVYLDGAASPIHCANGRHGCGYLDADGRRRPTFTIFSAREQMKRLARLCHAQGKPTLIVAHMSGMVTLPTLSFADLLLTGEQYWKSPDTFRPPLEFFRVECMGHPHGLPTDFIGYPPLGGPWAQTMTALHNAPSPWCAGGWDVLRLYRHFDVDQARWHPYWQPGGLATADKPEVRISGFCQAGRKALLAVGNTSAVAVQTTLTFNQAALGFGVKTERVRDPLTGAALRPTEQGWRFQLEPEATRWLWIEANP